jgi:hypothetical protein
MCEATKIQMQGWDAHFITLHCISRKVVCDPFLQDDTCRCYGDAMSHIPYAVCESSHAHQSCVQVRQSILYVLSHVVTN